MGALRSKSPAGRVLQIHGPRPLALTLLVLVAACGTTHGTTGTGGPSATTGRSTASAATTTTVTTTPAGATAAQWITSGGSFSRTASDASFPAVTATPTRRWTSPALDGAVYGEPLVVDGQVLVATENDTVYDLSAVTGKVQWSDHLATPAPSGALPCGDIAPTVGITSTMVIDPVSGTVYASAETGTGGTVGHVVFAIGIATHRVLWSRHVDRPGWTAAAQLQRAGLALSDGRVMVGFGGNYGDCGQYHGWVVGVPETGTGALSTYEVPTAREGAVWAPAGITVNASGDLFVATGNGSAGAGQRFDHGDAVIELSGTLAELAYFAPTDWAQDNADDGDLGSTSPVLLPDGRLFMVGKQATAYLLASAALGGIGGQLASLAVCNSQGANAYGAPDIYVACPDAGAVVQVHIGPGNTMQRGWTWTSPTGGASSPTVAGGVVWTIDGGSSVLYGIDASTGATRFALPLDTGRPEHFAGVAVAGTMIVVPGSSAVEAFS